MAGSGAVGVVVDCGEGMRGRWLEWVGCGIGMPRYGWEQLGIPVGGRLW